MPTITSRCPYFLLLLALVCGPFALIYGQPIHSCTVIPTERPVTAASAPSYLPPGARAAVSYRSNPDYDPKWTNGSTITVGFRGGSSALRARVMRYAREWTNFANLAFRVVSDGPADIRVGFEQNGASWSMVGNASSRTNPNGPSMNFGWLTDQTPDDEVRRTVLHEFGHALGLLHEHQNPEGGIPWDKEVVYDHYRRTQGWDQRTTYNNVMATADRNTTQYSAYDRASIMHYPISPRLTGGRYTVGMNNQLSPMDQHYIALMYPGRRASSPTPKPTVTTTERPRPVPTAGGPTTTANRRVYTVNISNELGQGVREETVQLYIGERRFNIRLDRAGRTRQQLALDLPPGKHRYRVVTSSTYFGYRNVRNSRGQVIRKYFEQEVRGDGQGELTVTGNAALSLYGSYDRERGRMKVYLAQGK